ncbi:sex peptide receptor-related protein 2-like [Ylistrum balloti]|uniref:sex peptide receptor-related protein 2-like n=1 Tax=Ylistrum balloti TaxID=509963 RepID=UPI002905D7EA|nr:sex peptide receptor-related protein 2-like [Ylistrum balloti]
MRNCFPPNVSMKFGMESSATSRHASHRVKLEGMDMEFFIVNFEETFRYHFEIYIYGYAWPFLTLIVVVLNSIILYILAKKRMMTRNVTHLVIGTICLFDMLTIVIPGCAYVYVFDFLGIRTYLPYDLCSTWYLLTSIVPTVCHSTVNLLTVLLAFQRCLSVTYPLQVSRWFTAQRTVTAMLTCFVISIVPEIVDIFRFGHHRVDIYLEGNATFSACSMEPVTDDVTMIYIPHVIVSLLLFKVIPCILLIVFGIIMIRQVRRAARMRCYLLHVIRNDDHVKHARAHEHHREVKLTIMISWVIGVFLVFEVPAAILVALSVISLVFHVDIICRDDLETTLSLMYIIVIATFVSNFVIYYVCCYEFRAYFKHMMTHARKSTAKEAVHSKISNTKITFVSQISEQELSSTTGGQGHGPDTGNRLQTPNSEMILQTCGHKYDSLNHITHNTKSHHICTSCDGLKNSDRNITNGNMKNNRQQTCTGGSLQQMSSYL